MSTTSRLGQFRYGPHGGRHRIIATGDSTRLNAARLAAISARLRAAWPERRGSGAEAVCSELIS